MAQLPLTDVGIRRSIDGLLLRFSATTTPFSRIATTRLAPISIRVTSVAGVTGNGLGEPRQGRSLPRQPRRRLPMSGAYDSGQSDTATRSAEILRQGLGGRNPHNS